MAAEPLVVLRRKDYPESDRSLDRIFSSIGTKPPIAVECDSASSLITEVEAGRGIALATPVLELVTGKRQLYRPLTGATEVLAVGIATATKSDVTTAGQKFAKSCAEPTRSFNHKWSENDDAMMRWQRGEQIWQKSYPTDFLSKPRQRGFCDYLLVDGNLVCSPVGPQAT